MNSSFLFKKDAFSLKDKAFITDPYPWYCWMRHNSPFLETHGVTLITRHADVSSALNNPHLSPHGWTYHINSICEKLQIRVPEKARKFIELTLAALDEPAHTQWRAAMLKVFNAQILQHLRKCAKESAEELLTGKTEVDIINDCARELWIEIFSRWLGLTKVQQTLIEEKLASMRLFVDPARLNETNLSKALTDLNDVMVTLEAVQENVTSSSGFFSELKSYNIPGAEFNRTDVAVMAASVLSGGGETTQALSGSLFYILAGHPAALDAIRHDSNLTGKVLNEVARLESPLQFTQRYALCETKINDFDIKKGTRLLLCLGSANRDESVFGSNADTFDMNRKHTHVLTFGRGARHCIGSVLARMQAEVLLNVFLEKNSRIEITDEHTVWQTKSSLMRSLERLIIRTGT